MKISKTEKNYHIVRDECTYNSKCRRFGQILPEHALALVDLAIAHANDNKSEIMRQTEKLTELHLEWQSKTTKRSDSKRWRDASRKATRAFSYSVMKLTAVVFPGKGELRHTNNQISNMLNDVSVGANMGTDFHAGWANLNSDWKENLKQRWVWYGRMNIKMLVKLKGRGSGSDAFFKAATNSMEAGISMGKFLDDL